MIRRRYIAAIGFWLIILSFLGLPGSWKTAFLIITGIILVLFAFYSRFKVGGNVGSDRQVEAFVDNGSAKFPENKAVNSLEPTDAKVSNPQK